MKRFIVYNQQGEILRGGSCQDDTFLLQAKAGEFIIKGTANDVTQKIVNGQVVNKTPEEIGSEKPPEIPESKRQAGITNEQWRDVLNRLNKLDNRSAKTGE